MEGKVHAAVVSFITVILAIAFYNTFLKPYTPATVQGYIGL